MTKKVFQGGFQVCVLLILFGIAVNDTISIISPLYSLSLSLSFYFFSSTLLIAYNKISFNLPNISRGSSMVPAATRALS